MDARENIERLRSMAAQIIGDENKSRRMLLWAAELCEAAVESVQVYEAVDECRADVVRIMLSYERLRRAAMVT